MAIPYSQHTALAAASTSHDLVALIGRVMLVAIFLMSGFQHDWQLPNTVAYFSANGLPAPEVGAVIAITIEVGAGLMVLSGWNARWGALAMAIFSILTSLLFHAYWSEPLPARMSDFINFWKNVSIAGGFLMVFALGPGRYSYRRSVEVVRRAT